MNKALIGILNGKFRAECVNAHWFMNLAGARGKCEQWHGDCNTQRLHSAVGYLPSAEARQASGLMKPALKP